MANKYRGEVEFSANGSTYTFRLGTNELCRLEAELGADPFEKIAEGKASLGHLRTITLAGLGRHHPKLTADDVGDLIDEVGYKALGDLIQKSMSVLAPEDDASKPEAAGTGPVSLPPASGQG